MTPPVEIPQSRSKKNTRKIWQQEIPTITLIGNLANDPELRFTPSGAAVAKFRVASTPRYHGSGRLMNGKMARASSLQCQIWRQAAENVAESLNSTECASFSLDRLKQRSYETKEGEKRTVFEVEVDEVGPSLRNATAKVTTYHRARRRSSFSSTCCRFISDDLGSSINSPAGWWTVEHLQPTNHHLKP
jgi:single stranded DNA-binding protein